MTVICVELTPLGSVPLGVMVVRLARPFDGVSHPLHDGHDHNRLNIEVVLGDTDMVFLRGLALT